MTRLLKQAIQEIERLPEDEQDTIAALILEEIDADAKWDELIADRRSEAFLQEMGERIKKQRQEGKLMSGEDFLKETE